MATPDFKIEDDKPQKHAIAVPQEDYDSLSQKLGQKSHFMHKFCKDSFKTRIWRTAGGTLMGTDHRFPDGREIVVMTRKMIDDIVPLSMKGIVVRALIEVQGHSIQHAMGVAAHMTKLIDTVEEKIRKITDKKEQDDKWMSTMGQLIMIADRLIEEMKKDPGFVAKVIIT